MFEKTEGRAQNLAGKVQEAVGDVIGDRGTQFEGRARQVAGRMQESYGGALDQLRDVTASQPLAALATVAALSFVIGALWSRR
ncbi:MULTISPECIES: CsbD family protein [Burkholderia]|uniref:CsbD family protein n=2 Tax=Burkholderia gladioli TaxID=28095 RepID=A0A095Y215_BURGA|nr:MULTISPECIES: CsbD family protein [Burkholderia]AEA64963.1 CsbD family protein [Burkholderia gladioli BSR3]AJW94715.1 csbD-like family protein [Burkholderia gladioli]ASD83932.1 CsbD family protein [Burkholderia gladioli pv. gladioli]ATF88745.1 CsbD family protein [Burkholderia gladioli pv. gladioli]AWY51356.1 CsbD family protein [Burkholderia gladioli pv. gladioli]